MPGVNVVRAGSLEGDAADIAVGVEFFTKDRKGYVKEVEGAQQAKTMS